jgi:hypothetical protein
VIVPIELREGQLELALDLTNGKNCANLKLKMGVTSVILLINPTEDLAEVGSDYEK